MFCIETIPLYPLTTNTNANKITEIKPKKTLLLNDCIILKIFFFPDVLGKKAKGGDKASYVAGELIRR